MIFPAAANLEDRRCNTGAREGKRGLSSSVMVSSPPTPKSVQLYERWSTSSERPFGGDLWLSAVRSKAYHSPLNRPYLPRPKYFADTAPASFSGDHLLVLKREKQIGRAEREILALVANISHENEIKMIYNMNRYALYGHCLRVFLHKPFREK
jgi:hypothetical protein